MELEHLSRKLLVWITEEEESIAIKPENNVNKETIQKTVTLDEFFNTFLNSKANITIEKISVLELSNCQLVELPVFFENFNLKHLDLSQNKLKNVPPCVYSGLKYLEYLNLGHNRIQNFDSPPACLLNVKIVKLNNNLLSNVPKWILTFQSTNLEELDFSFNKATRYDYNQKSCNMDSIKMKKLKLRNSQLIDKDVNFLKCFQYLKYLDISNKDDTYINKLYEPDNLFVKPRWKELIILKMNNMAISFFPEGILWIESLTELHLSQNSISWFPDGIKYMVNLQVLDISRNTLIAIPEQVAKLECLEVLLVAHNAIEVCTDLKKMQSLKILDLYDNLLENVSINCDKLECFDLDQNYLDTDSIPNYSLKKNNNLRKYFTSDEIRTNTKKIKYDNESYYEGLSSEDDSSSRASPEETSVNMTMLNDGEDWDSPVAPIRPRNPEIESEDDTWDGEEGTSIKIKPKMRQMVYIEDEDWMFEDVEDEIQ